MKTRFGIKTTDDADFTDKKRSDFPIRVIRVIRGLLICALLLGALTTTWAATNTVTSLADSGPGSLRQAIADAAPGDTIDFAITGTITLTSGELVIANDLNVIGPGQAMLTVSGNNARRVFWVTDGTVVVSSLSVSNGYGPSSGGGIANSANLTISNCCITACNVYTDGGSTGAGGIANFGNLTIVDSSVTKNGSTGGGVSAYWVGGILNYGSRDLKLIRSAVTENSGIVCGGVLNGGTMSATNSTVSRNMGTGILTAGIYSGGVNTLLWLQSSTVCSNHGGNGCGIRKESPSDQCHFANSILGGNENADLGLGSFVSDDFNLIQNTGGATITGTTTHNIYGHDPLLGPLADNGGLTPTHALLPGSPAIDHGSSGGLTTDQRGLPRPFNFPAYFNTDDASDIGAYELQERAQTGPVFTVNTTDDVDDGVPGIAHCSLREAIAAANANADTNTIDFAVEVPGVHTGTSGTIGLTNWALFIINNLTINGPGAAKLTISGNHKDAVFVVLEGVVHIAGVTIADGFVDFPPPWGGGGIYNEAHLTLSDCAIVNNGAGWAGGGIYNASVAGTLSIENSEISKNGAGYGGGVYALALGSLQLVNTLISSNSARYGGGGGYLNNGAIFLTNVTISGNSAQHGAGLVLGGEGIMSSSTVVSNYQHGIVAFASLSIQNTILAGNSGMDFNGNINSLDYNLIQNTNGATITGVTTHNIYDQDPLLGPLADNGGPTPTHALRFDSPALDAGNSGGLTTDQRGLPRPIDDPNTPNADGGDGSDIGAYEADPNLRLLAPEKIGGDIRLRFNTVLGRTYRVESEDNLNNSWTVLSNNITGDGSSVQAVDSGAAAQPRRFYRGVLLP